MHHSTPGDHPRHDPTLIAGLAAGNLADPDRNRAEALLATCTSCGELHRDLLAIQGATRIVPAPALRAVDFRLTAEQAQHLRRGSWLRTLLRPFAGAGSSLRPVAAAMTSVGVAGLLVATFIPGLFGSAAFAPTRDLATGGAGAESTASGAPAATPDDNAQGVTTQGSPVGPAIEVEPTGSVDPDMYLGASLPPGESVDIDLPAAGGGKATDGGSQRADQPSPLHSLRETSTPTTLLTLGSLGLIAVGLALFTLRYAARRVR